MPVSDEPFNLVCQTFEKLKHFFVEKIKTKKNRNIYNFCKLIIWLKPFKIK